MNSRLISIDQSSTKTGVAVYDGTDLMHWELIDLSKNKDAKLRFDKMCVAIDCVIRKYKPSMVVFEDISLRISPKTLIMLGRLQGAIILSCLKNDISYVAYAPSQWRKIVGIKQSGKIMREELKIQAINLINTYYGITVNDDVAEGLLIGLAHLKASGVLPSTENLQISQNKQVDFKEI